MIESSSSLGTLPHDRSSASGVIPSILAGEGSGNARPARVTASEVGRGVGEQGRGRELNALGPYSGTHTRTLCRFRSTLVCFPAGLYSRGAPQVSSLPFGRGFPLYLTRNNCHTHCPLSGRLRTTTRFDACTQGLILLGRDATSSSPASPDADTCGVLGRHLAYQHGIDRSAPIASARERRKCRRPMHLPPPPRRLRRSILHPATTPPPRSPKSQSHNDLCCTPLRPISIFALPGL